MITRFLIAWTLVGAALLAVTLLFIRAEIRRVQLREIANEEMQLKTLREFRFRAVERGALVPRPDPATCGRHVRKPLPRTNTRTTELDTERLEARTSASENSPSVRTPYVLLGELQSCEHFEHRVSRSIPPQQ